MKISEFLDQDALSVGSDHEHEHGTIAKLGLSKNSAIMLKRWCDNNKIPCIDPEKLHCTVLFSRTPVTHLCKLDGSSVRLKADISGWKKLGQALTVELGCPLAHSLHQWMIDQGGTHDHPSFIAHTTLAYDWEREDLPAELPGFPLVFDRLHVEGINPKYAENSSK